MIYFNTAFPIRSNPRRQTCRAIIGQCRNRFRSDFMLRLPFSFLGQEQLRPGLHRDLTIQRDEDGGPLYIAASAEGALFLILSSRLTNDRGFVGNIRAPRSQRVAILARAVAPRSAGQWETLILKVRKGDAFYVNWNRPDGSDAVTEFCYADQHNSVLSCSQCGIPSLFTDLGVTPPFTVRDDPDQFVSRLVRREWAKL